MADLSETPDQEPKPKRGFFRFVADMWLEGGSERTRLVVWVVLVGFAVYLIGTGVVGIITKSN